MTWSRHAARVEGGRGDMRRKTVPEDEMARMDKGRRA